MTKRRLLVFGAAAALVLIVAIAVILDAWQLALVALAVLQAGALAIAVDARAKVALAIALDARDDKVADEQLVRIGDQLHNVGKRTLAAIESSRLEAADRRSDTDERLASISERLSKLQSRDTDEQLASISERLSKLQSRDTEEQLASISERLSALQSRDTEEQLASIGERLSALQSRDTEEQLASISERLSALQSRDTEEQLASIGERLSALQSRDTEEQLASISERLLKLQSRDSDDQLASIGERLSKLQSRDSDDQLASISERLSKLQSRDTEEQLASISERLSALQSRDTDEQLQSRFEEQKKLALAQVRQIEALMQLFRRVEPRAPMPSSGGWALDAINILTVLDLIETRRPGLVVELGSGTSSVWIGYALEQMGSRGRLVSFESDSEFAAITEAQIHRHALDNTVEIRSAALVEPKMQHHDTPWYDAEVFDDLDDIDLLIVDGPAKATGPMARYPAIHKLNSRMSDRATVALDDTERPDEEGIVRRWLEETPGLREVRSAPDDTLAVLDWMPQTRFFR